MLGDSQPRSLTERVIHFCMQNTLIVSLGLVFVVAWGMMVAPFDWDAFGLPRDPVAVDAIPNLGENQQIVFTDWPGRSPQDMEDQVTYPLTVSLLGIPGVRSVRSLSMFGFSTIYVIFEDGVEFYWSRSRILEKLASLPENALPDGVAPALGPDSTALGQVYWYTLEGRDPDGNPAGGWDLHELRSVQDWYVRYALTSAEGVSEVASIGGHVQEYQVDLDPDAMRAHGVTLDEVMDAVRRSNADVGARTIEVNRVEYVIRGRGLVRSTDDLARSVVKNVSNVPVLVRHVGTVQLGPAQRRGALDKAGAEAVGGVVVVRQGANPLEAIKNVKAKVEELSPGLPVKAAIDFGSVETEEVRRFAAERGFEALKEGSLNQDAWITWLRSEPRDQWPGWITTSQLTVVPFYDRTGLIQETLGTLSDAIALQILITVLVVIVMMRHLRSSLLISAVLPLAVLIAFIAMKVSGVEANVVALSGIAIAIGTVVDMGVILCENILRHLDEADPKANRVQVVYGAACEVGSAVLTAIATTVVSFLPVFAMAGPEGRMFRPLAFTKTFALIASVAVALTVIPVLARYLLAGRIEDRSLRRAASGALVVAGAAGSALLAWWIGLILAPLGVFYFAYDDLPDWLRRSGTWIATAAGAIVVTIILAQQWLPLGPARGSAANLAFVVAVIAVLLGSFGLLQGLYPRLLRWFLDHKLVYLAFPTALVVLGLFSWLGAGRVLGFLPESVRRTDAYTSLNHAFPGFGKEFMPPLDEGSFLYMPTTMPHASIGEALDVVQLQDRAFAAIPEIDMVVGKIGRSESALDPAPVSMVETLIQYKPEYRSDADGRRMRFRFDYDAGDFARDAHGGLIPDPTGLPYRQWRDEIRSPDDIWAEIVRAGAVPGMTSAPKLQPIVTRQVMLQSGMRAPMGVKVRGPNLEAIERVGLEIEAFLRKTPSVEPATVYAERIVGKPYLEIDIDREAIARFGLRVRDVQDVIEMAIGGEPLTTTIEGRERYPVRVRYNRELRDDIESLERVLVPADDGTQVPLVQVADIRYVRGPEMIKSEDTFLVGYVTFDKKPGLAEVDVVEQCRAFLQHELDSGEWSLPTGVSYTFAGNYENQIHAQKTLAVVLPLSLLIIYIILYLQFRSTITTLIVFSGIAVAWSGGFLLMWLYAQPWFLDFTVAGANMRDLFQVHPILLSVAIWVGFLALFGIATDDGVVMATYLEQTCRARRTTSVAETRAAVVSAGVRRIRPCLMTTATTILALLPVLTSTGRGSDVMIPMAIPSFGGMVIELMTLFLVPVLYCAAQECALRVPWLTPRGSDSGGES